MIITQRMQMETALTIPQAAIKQCRDKKGVQIAVTVVDRWGHALVVLRDVLAPDITLTLSKQKAYTAAAFNAATLALAGRFSNPFSVGKVDGSAMFADGLPINAGGTILGGWA